MHPSTLAKRVQIALSLAFIAFYFYGLGQIPLVGPDEPRYAQVAREMLVRHDWITPTLGGYTWFEKPVLLYWLTIPAFRFFGVHEWTARLGPATFGVLTVLAVWWLAREVESSRRAPELPNFALSSLLVAASCLGVIVFSRAASFDIVITATITWALCCFLRCELTSDLRSQRKFLVGFYALVGVSLIAKGLVGIVIPVGVVGLYFLLRRVWPSRVVWMSLLWGLPLAFLVSSVWYGPVIYRHGWRFIDEFFVQHHFARYVSNKYRHPQPIYFYPAILLMLSVPWSPFLIHALTRAKKWSWRGNDEVSRLCVFAFSWILFPILFFSFSGSKLPGYILPVLPAALILGSISVARLCFNEQTGWPLGVSGALSILMGLIGLWYGIRVEHLSTICVSAAAFPFIGAGLFAIIWKREQWLSFVALCSSVLLAMVIVLNCVAPVVSSRESVRDLMSTADAKGYSDLKILALPGDDRSAQFYGSDRVIYGPRGEVTGLDEAPLLVAEARKRKERLLAFIPAVDLDLFRNKPGIEVIGDNGKLALLCLY